MRPWLIGFLCGGVAVALAYQGRLDGLENRVLDLRFRICSPRPAPQQVVIVAIDNESIMRLGRWPWPRRVHAELIRQLNEAGARVVALDMLFATPTADDPLLTESVSEASNVVLSSFVAQGKTDHLSGIAPLPSIYDGILEGHGVSGPVPALEQAAAGIGHVNLTPDSDGVVRRAPLVIRARDALLPSLSLRAAMLCWDLGSGEVQLHENHLQLGPLAVPTDSPGTMLIRHYGGAGTFPEVPYHEVLAGGLRRGDLDGRIVLVGVKATAVTDLHATPCSPAQPGVEINATVLANLLTGDFLRRASDAWLVLLTFVSSLLAAVYSTRLRLPFIAALLALQMTALYALGAYLFRFHAVWLPFVAPTVAMVAAAFTTCAVRSALAERDRSALRGQVQALSDAAEMLSAATSRDRFCEVAAEGARKLTGWDGAVTWLESDAGPEDDNGVPETIAARLRHGDIALIEGDDAAATLEALAKHAERTPKSAVCVALRSEGELAGALCLLSRRCRRLRRSDRDLLAAYASAAAAAAENLRLHQQLRGDVELANRDLARAYGDLALEKDKLESIVQQMGDGVIMLDRDHRIAVVNPAAEELLGILAVKSAGERPEDAMEGNVAEALSMATTSDAEMEREVETPGPGKRVLLLRSAPLSEPTHSPPQDRRQGTIVVLSDITAIRHLSDMKSEYVSTVSHELRSPLTVIKASASTLESSIDDQLPPELEQQLLGAITRQSDRLLRMINDLLDAARLEAGHELRIDVAEHDLVSVLDEMISDYRHSGELDGHALDFEVRDAMPALIFDRERVQQIVANLISNAVKYSPDGGTVGVRVEREDGFVVVSVSDEGIGIPEEDLPRLFGRYHRCDTVHHRKIKGTGPGLYVTRALVEAHGGWIKAKSESGKGSTFRFGLPFKAPGSD